MWCGWCRRNYMEAVMWEHLLMLFMGDSLPYTLSTPSYNIHTLIIHWQDFQMELEKTTFTMLWKNELNKCYYCSKANTRTRQPLQCGKTKDKGVYSVHWNSKHKRVPTLFWWTYMCIQVTSGTNGIFKTATHCIEELTRHPALVLKHWGTNRTNY